MSDDATTGLITVGNASAVTGQVSITRTQTAAGSGGTISVSGGSTISINQNIANSVNTDATAGAINVLGSADTTSVSVITTPSSTKSSTQAGVASNSVVITDVNGGSASTSEGTITSATVSGFSTLGITGNGLTTLNIAHGSGNIIIDNSSSLATVTNKTLALTINGQTKGVLDDADVYTTLNVTTTGANSTLSNLTFGAATALTVAGSKGLTLTSAAGLTALKTVTVSGSAGLTADLSAASITAVDTSATTGSSKLTIDAKNATFKGGAGVDQVTLAATTPAKAINLGAGDDSLDLSAITAAPTAAIGGGDGIDTLKITAANAATTSADAKFAGLVTGFEKLVLAGATNQTIDLSVLGSFHDVTTSAGNGLTLSNIGSGGSLTLNGAGTAYTVSDSSFATGKSDVINLNLTDGNNKAVDFATTGITASGVENFNISVADTQATPSGSFNDTVTLLGNSVKNITVTGDAGLTLTATSTALTTVDASGITKGGFTWTSGALAAASTIHGSATGTNTINASAATAAVNYTGGTGADAVTINNAKSNTVALGDGANTFVGGAGNNNVTAGTGNDTVVVTTGNNTVSLGDGANSFTATSGNNTYTGGTGDDTVTVGSGINILTLGTGADVVTISAAGANVNSYTTIADAHSGITINLVNQGTEVFASSKVVLAGTAVFQDYANAVVQAGGNATTNAKLGWFEWSGDTYLVESLHDGSTTPSFVNGTDVIIKLSGLVDLSTADQAGHSFTLA